MPNLTDDDELITPEQFAREIIPDGSPRTAERWRTTGAGPTYVKLGRKIYYRRGDVRDWLRAQRRTHTIPSEPKGRA